MTHPKSKSHIVGTGALVRTGQVRRLPPADSEAEKVIGQAAAYEHVPPAMLLQPTRCRAPVAHARQLAMYLMHTLLGRTMTEVGLYFGRDRTTVAHACGKIEDQRDDAAFDAALTLIEDSVLNGADDQPSHYNAH